MMFKIMNGTAYLEDIFTKNIGRSVYNLRIFRRNLALPAVKTDYTTGTVLLLLGQKSGIHYLMR